MMAEALRQIGEPSSMEAALPFVVERWDRGPPQHGEVVARAASSGLAFACFYSALREHLGALIVLRLGGRVLASSRPLNSEQD